MINKPDVIVDFTNPAVIYENAKKMFSAGIHVVIGTTGFTAEQRDELDDNRSFQLMPIV